MSDLIDVADHIRNWRITVPKIERNPDKNSLIHQTFYDDVDRKGDLYKTIAYDDGRYWQGAAAFPRDQTVEISTIEVRGTSILSNTHRLSYKAVVELSRLINPLEK